MRVIGFKEVELEKIRVPEWARRTVIDGTVIDAIAESIETYMQMNPVIVRDLGDGNYELIAGYQRYLAMRKRGRSKIEAKVVECTDEEALTLSLEENLKRAEEHPFDVAKKIAYMHDVLGMDDEKIASKFGRGRTWVTTYRSLNKICEEAKAELAPKVKDFTKLSSIARIGEKGKQYMVARLTALFDLDRKEVEELVEKAESMDLISFGVLYLNRYLELRRASEEGLSSDRRVSMLTLYKTFSGGERGAGGAGGVEHVQPPRTPEMPLAQGSQAGGAQPAEQPSDQVQPPAQGPQAGQEGRKGPETYTCNLCREKRERFKIKFYGFCNDRHDDLHGMLWDLRGLPQEDMDSIFTVLRQVKDFLITYPKEQRGEIAMNLVEMARELKGLGIGLFKEIAGEVKRRHATS
jgi:ParB/RepB/Spo0J family partition protein